MTYKRMARGSFKQMTPEQQRAHLSMLAARYREKNREKLRERNRIYWATYKQNATRCACVCKICGKEFKAVRILKRCAECRAMPTQKTERPADIHNQQNQRRTQWDKILELARTGMLQKEISKITGVKQEAISQLCIRNGIRRKPKTTRRK